MDQLVSTFLLIIPISVHSFLIFLCYQSQILPLIANMSCFFPLVFFVNVFLFNSIHAPPYFLRMCLSSSIRVAVSMMALGSQPSTVLLTATSSGVSEGSLITNLFLLLALGLNAGT